MQFPRAHFLLTLTLVMAMTGFVAAKYGNDPQEERFTTTTVLSSLPTTAIEPVITELTETDLLDNLTPSETPAADEGPKWREETAKVRPGDNLALIFKRHGLSPRDVHAVSTSEPLGKRLRNIFPGHELTLLFSEDDQLMGLNYASGPLDTLIYEREGDVFTSRQETAEPERLRAYKHGVIEHSLFVASQRAGLTDNLTMRLAQIFQWDIDFVLDIRPNDAFYVIYEELYHKEEFVGHGDILAAEFTNQGEHFRAIQYVNAEGDKDYFTPEGESMRKAFLRAPVEFSRISSNFNLRRKHPLWKTVRPHRGIDYAAPVGTPIMASGDGRVSRAGWTDPNGNFVFIQHGEQFETKYLHLSRIAKGISKGAKVRQGQIIGYLGATGWVTGPHLHYEFLVNGVHQNPRTVSLPDAEPVADAEMARFKEQIIPIAKLLDNYKNQVMVALAE